MTVGISILNKTKACLISDAQITIQETPATTAQKSAILHAERFHGAICGAGDGQYVLEMNRTAERLCREECRTKPIGELVTALHRAYQEMVHARVANQIAAKRGDIDEKIRTLGAMYKEETRKRDAENLVQEYDHLIRRGTQGTELLLTAYCRDTGRARTFNLKKDIAIEGQDKYSIAGTSDLARSYLLSTIQGLDFDCCDSPDLAYLGVNAYNHASLSLGVGGTPRIVLIDEEDTRLVGLEESTAMLNISAYHLARAADIPAQEVRERYREILADEADFEAIAKRLLLPPHILLGMPLPYSAVLEFANRSFRE